jgi:hypothetical protein
MAGSGVESASERAGQLRRLQSYPEQDQDKSEGSGVTPRTSYSLCNLKAASAPSSGGATEGGGGEGVGQCEGRGGQLTPDKLCMLPSELDEGEDRNRGPRPPGEGGGHSASGRGHGYGHSREGEEGGGGRSKSHMVSYSTGPNSLREGRIRRWLQDMDKATD